MDKIIYSAEFAERMAEKMGTSKAEAARAATAFLETVKDALKEGDKIALPKFGSFQVKKTSQRTGRNPRTKQECVIPAGYRPAFKASSVLRQEVDAASRKNWG